MATIAAGRPAARSSTMSPRRSSPAGCRPGNSLGTCTTIRRFRRCARCARRPPRRNSRCISGRCARTVSKTGPNRPRGAFLSRALGPADEDAGEGGVVAAAHPVVVDEQELSRQDQIDQAGISGEMQAPTGRSGGAAELALVGGHNRLAGPISLAFRAQPVAGPGQHDLVVVLPPCPDPGGKRRRRIDRQRRRGDPALRDPAGPGLKTVRKQGADISRARGTEQQRLPRRDRSHAAENPNGPGADGPPEAQRCLVGNEGSLVAGTPSPVAPAATAGTAVVITRIAANGATV